MSSLAIALGLSLTIWYSSALSQELDPLERNHNGISYSDRSVRYDTTKSYYVDLVMRISNYNGKPLETLYNRYVDFFDKQSGARVKRVDLQQVLRKTGFKIIEGRDHTKTYFSSCAVNDRFVAFTCKDGGMVAVDIHTYQIIYDHKNRNDSVWPFWANEDFSMAIMIEKKTSEEGFDKSSYVIFDKNFKIIAKISYNLSLGKHEHIKNGIMSIPSTNEFYNQTKFVNYIDINLDLLNRINQLQANSYAIEDHGVSIGNGLIRIKDSGDIVTELRPNIKSMYTVTQSQWRIMNDTLRDGKYYVRASNYFPENATLFIEGNVIKTYQFPSTQDIKPLAKSEIVTLKLQAEKINGEFYFDKFTGKMLKSAIPDGTYDIAWSDYLEVDKPLSITNGQILISPPYFKSNENVRAISFKYQGFNYSHSGLTDTLGLEIIFFK